MVAATIVTAAVVAIASATAKWALETGARIATNARGVARKILARFRSTRTRRASFAGKKDSVVLGDTWLRCRLGTWGLNGLGSTLFMNFRVTDGRGMQGAFVGGIRFRFSQCVRVERSRFDGIDLFGTDVLGFGVAGVNLFLFVRVFFGLRWSLFLFFGVLVKNGAADHGVGCSVGLRLFMLSFDQAGRNDGNLLVANIFFSERRVGVRGFLLDRAGRSRQRLRSGHGRVVRGETGFFCGRFCFIAGFG
jgi:hypothetical protein